MPVSIFRWQARRTLRFAAAAASVVAAGGFERQADADGAVAVGVGLDHADHARDAEAGGGAAAADEAGEDAVVAGQRVEIDPGEGRPDRHVTPCPARCWRTACTG